MGLSRYTVRSSETVVFYLDYNDPRMGWVRKVSVGRKKDGNARHLMVVPVPKLRQVLTNRSLFASAVVALDFRQGNLHVDLANPAYQVPSYGVDDVVTWTAFDRHLNKYAENPGRIVIRKEELTAPSYDLSFDSDEYGDRLTLVGMVRKGGRRECSGSVIHVNLSAMITFAGLAMSTDGSIRWSSNEGEDDLAARWDPVEGEVSPFFLVTSDDRPHVGREFMRRSFERMCAWMPSLSLVSWCEAMYNAERGGSPEATIARFRQLLAGLPR